MDSIGDIKYGNKLGYKLNCKYIYRACDVCNKAQWVQFINNKPISTRCRSCSQKHRTDYSNTNQLKQDGIKCKRCGKVYPVNSEYFPKAKHNRIGLGMVCKDCINKRTRERLIEQGKVKLDRTAYLRELKLKRELADKKFNELAINRNNIKGTIGEIRKGRDLGLRDGFPHQYLACIDCGVARWVRLVKGKPQNLRCHDCASKISGQSQKGKSFLSTKTKEILDSGVRECNKCHRILPADDKNFVKSPKSKLGIGAICKDCKSKVSREKLESLGQVKNTCSVCGKITLVYNTGKQKPICGGCSQKLSGKQSLPRGERLYKPKTKSCCHTCGQVFPATIKYWAVSKVTKSGLRLGMCRKCLNRTRHEKERATLTGRLNHRFSTYIYQSLRGEKAGNHWEALVGYTVKDLIKHLQKHFTKGMDWNNYGKWHIDHIIPQSAFHYTSPDDIDFKRCWALGNLQPLWSEDNVAKGAQILKPFQPSLKLENKI